RAPAPTSPSTRPAGRRFRRRLARAAPRDPRLCAPAAAAWRRAYLDGRFDAMAQAALARPSREGRRGSIPWRAALARVSVIVVVVLALWGCWELYRWVWIETGWTWPFPVNDTTLPHVHTIFKALGEPSRVQGPLLISVLLKSAWFTAKEALVGFLLGAGIGFLLAVILVHSRLLQRGFLP